MIYCFKSLSLSFSLGKSFRIIKLHDTIRVVPRTCIINFIDFILYVISLLI